MSTCPKTPAVAWLTSARYGSEMDGARNAWLTMICTPSTEVACPSPFPTARPSTTTSGPAESATFTLSYTTEAADPPTAASSVPTTAPAKSASSATSTTPSNSATPENAPYRPGLSVSAASMDTGSTKAPTSATMDSVRPCTAKSSTTAPWSAMSARMDLRPSLLWAYADRPTVKKSMRSRSSASTAVWAIFSPKTDPASVFPTA